MGSVVVDMQSALLADAIATALKRFDSDFHARQSESQEKTGKLCTYAQADILLMEVTTYALWSLDEWMKLRNEVKTQNSNCKVVLVVDENTEQKLADGVRQAKGDGRIERFIYGSVSETYLSAVIDTL